MRRIVQLLKMVAKAQKDCRGLLISVLVAECYRPDKSRDDVALYNTIAAIHNRLQWNTAVYNPVLPGIELTYKDKYKYQVERFRDKLGEILEWLKPLFDVNCDELAALQAWNKVFIHDYWSDLCDAIELRRKSIFVSSTGAITSQQPTVQAVQSPSHRFFGDEK
ncbi:MAG: hypothetical protein U0528_06070 [Anaerolineae bacterium]